MEYGVEYGVWRPLGVLMMGPGGITVRREGENAEDLPSKKQF